VTRIWEDTMPTTNYIIRDIPPELWKAVKIKAVQEGRPIRELVLELLERAVAPTKKGSK